jgi:hypothetical protein
MYAFEEGGGAMKRAGSIACLQFLVLAALAGMATACLAFIDTDEFSGLAVAKELQTTGVPAEAEILSVADTNRALNEDPIIRLEVEVRPADRQAFRATIERLVVTYLQVPQYQPGKVIAVRYDPRDPSRVSIDLGPKEAAGTGDPFRDNFTPGAPKGAALLRPPPVAKRAALLPPPPTPELYRGGSDDAADLRALLENGYLPLGTAGFHAAAAADSRQAVEQGKRIGATLVVLYGASTGAAAGGPLTALPFHPRTPGDDAESQVASVAGGQATIGSLPAPARTDHLATYWAKSRPPVLGIYSRALGEQEKARMMRNDGIVVMEVANGSPAAAAGIQEGDVIVAIDGKPILDANAVPAFLDSIAGRKVRINVRRDGSPLSMMVQLNPLAAP